MDFLNLFTVANNSEAPAQRQGKFFKIRDILVVSCALLVVGMSGCKSKPKEEEPAPPNMEVQSPTSSGSTSSSDTGASEKGAKVSSQESSNKGSISRVTKSDAKKSCKEKGLKGRDLKNCMREMTN